MTFSRFRTSGLLVAVLWSGVAWFFAGRVCVTHSGTGGFCWAAESTATDWRAKIDRAKGSLRALSESDLEARLAELRMACDRLDARLHEDGENGARWRRFLRLEQLRQELDRGKPTPAVLGQVYQRLTSGYDGLWLTWFTDLRQAILRYLQTAGSLSSPEFRRNCEEAIERLAEQLEEYERSGNAEVAWRIALTLRLLRELDQTPQLISEVGQAFREPNLRVSLSCRLIGRNVEGEVVNDVVPVNDCILKSLVVGQGVTNGKKSVVLIPCDDHAIIETVFQGTTHSQTTAYQGPVAVFSRGTTTLSATKRIHLSEKGVQAEPACAVAETSTTFTGMCAPRMLERIAWKKAHKQKAAAEYVAARLAEEKLRRRVEAEGAGPIAKLRDGLENRFRRPLREYGMTPDLLRFVSNAKGLQVVVRSNGNCGLAAPAAPPEAEDGDLVLRLHESMVNNIAHQLLSGMTMREDSLRSWAVERMQLKLDPPPADSEPVAVTFPAAMPPVAVEFDDNCIKLLIRGERIYKSDELISRKLKSVDITAEYEIRRDADGYKLVRQGEVRVLPTGYRMEEGKPLSAEVVLVRNALKTHLERAFKPERPLDFDLQADGRAIGRMTAIEAKAESGWLVLSWRLESDQPGENRVASSVASWNERQ